MKNFFTVMLMAIIGMSLASCSSDEPNEQKTYPRHEIALNANQMEQKNYTDKFAAKFWSELVSVEESDNLMISPLSLYQALAMSANGADDESLAELLALLGADSQATLDDINNFNKYLFSELPKVDPSVKLSLATSMWIENKYGSPLASFSNVCNTYFNSEVYNFAKGTEDARNDVNKWASNKTNGIIPTFLKEVPDLEVMLLAATYFKGRWGVEINKKDTEKGDFYNLSGAISKVDMMKTDKAAYNYATEKYTVYTLPYGNGGYQFSIIYPTFGMSVDECMTDVMAKGIPKVEDNEYICEMKFPKFELEYSSKNLIEVLANCGLINIATGQSWFNKIVPIKLCMSELLHSTKIKVSEEGTEAVAVTEAGFYLTGLVNGKPEPFVIDHPFGYVITESSTGVVLFMGRINEL